MHHPSRSHVEVQSPSEGAEQASHNAEPSEHRLSITQDVIRQDPSQGAESPTRRTAWRYDPQVRRVVEYYPDEEEEGEVGRAATFHHIALHRIFAPTP